jgi:aminopeptidase N
MTDTGLSGRLVTATAEGFWHPEQAALTEAYVGRYFDEIVTATHRRTRFVAQKIAELAFPRFAVAHATRDAVAALLARDDLVSALRRKVVDADDDLRRALVAREAI